jgi:hypothetical protein
MARSAAARVPRQGVGHDRDERPREHVSGREVARARWRTGTPSTGRVHFKRRAGRRRLLGRASARRRQPRSCSITSRRWRATSRSSSTSARTRTRRSSTLRDLALRRRPSAEPTKTPSLEGRAAKLDKLFDYVSGRATLTANQTLSKVADGIAHLNTAGKLGGAALASLFGDKPMMEAVAHLNNLPMLQRWRTELALLNPANGDDRRALQQQGLMLDERALGALALLRGARQHRLHRQARERRDARDRHERDQRLRKGSFGLSLMSAIGHEIDRGVAFARLADSDVRALGTTASPRPTGTCGAWRASRPRPRQLARC